MASLSTSMMNSHDPETLSEPLHQVKLLSALRSGDPALIHPFLTEIGKDKRKTDVRDVDTSAAALHLAVRCASAETVVLLLEHRAISPNGVHPQGSGTTALHLAASLGRADIVNLLLEQENINDTVRDSQGRTCRDVARGKEVIKVIDDSRAFLNASYRSLLHSYIFSPPTAQPPSPLLVLLESPRIRFVNLSYLEEDSGSSLLHEAAKRKDLRLIELAVRAGADVFVRNRRGKMAYDGTGKDDRVRVFLRQFANQDTTLIETPLLEPPTLKGYLNKYTNVAKGYNTRWFVLKNGVLSYYRHQEDETVASRGSISMKSAILKLYGTDRMRFDVQSTPSRGHSSGIQRWYMKANHPNEASRWIQAIEKSVEWYKRAEIGSGVDTEQPRSRKSTESSDSAGPKGTPPTRSHNISFSGSLSSLSLLRKGTRISHGTSSGMFTMTGPGGVFRQESDDGSLESRNDDDSGGDGGPQGVGDADDEPDSDSSDDIPSKTPPHEDNFELHGNSVSAQMDLTAQLLNNIKQPGEIKNTVQEAFTMVQGMLNEYMQMAKDREDWWKKEIQRGLERQTVWEESLATVVEEGEKLEQELRKRSRRRGSKFFDDGKGTVKGRPAPLPSLSARGVEEVQTPKPTMLPGAVASSTQTISEGLLKPLAKRAETQDTIIPPPPIDEYDTDDEDEFFDAIESNNLPNLVVPDTLMSPTHSEKQSLFSTEAYEGYKTLRQRLILTKERPPTSLWSVLKHSIGKDLTKISFPVFFNEPTSMLQRMAEDMEFTECLNVAAREQDPLKRIAFVAAFAMSNYSSTIGRIAKPFNPMLSETFEYVRWDKEYRYMSEQVSHHPPISACWAESPNWHYFGEVDAQNKFMGKSFEIRPTGVAHAELIIPEEWAPDYPKATGKTQDDKVREHFSWKKVTTNVSGFILGSPTIDHYGDMVVTNHRTGDKCILTFKPRGWRGRDAYEISGHVEDATGIVVYDIAGRWNSQLVARRAGDTMGILHPDTNIDSPSPVEYTLLWRNTEKPGGSPFNLTPFAITLNDCPMSLKPYLCPTDCRLRPDQRAFEMGRYETANDLKCAQEDKQRKVRKLREEGTLSPHRARWFTAETDGDTGERVWTPVRVKDSGQLEYWNEREKVWKYRQVGVSGGWKDVEDIFIEEPDFIKDFEAISK